MAVCKGPDCTRGGSDAVFAKAREVAPSHCEVYRGGCYGLCHLGPNVVLREDTGGKRDPFSREDFQLMLSGVAQKSGRELQILDQRGAAADHPVSATCLETEYLKFFVCRVV